LEKGEIKRIIQKKNKSEIEKKKNIYIKENNKKEKYQNKSLKNEEK